MRVKYFHPVCDGEGKPLTTANIIWAERDRGSAYYRTSRFAMKAGKFPSDHPCAAGDGVSNNRSEMGSSPQLQSFRDRGYWASCFPEGDGITLYWWPEYEPLSKSAETVMADIRECFGWEVEMGR